MREEFEFAYGKFDWPAPTGNLASAPIECEVGDTENVGGAVSAAEQRADTRQELAEGERFY
jgi:hypothetical protein